MPYELRLFPESYNALQLEILNHPRLCKLIANHPPQEFELRLAEIATYCEVVLDGLYDERDLDNICQLCWKKLKKMNSSIILID